ncbi:MAG: TRAP transporter large permease subunit [Alphaproteobacteria bacterium]|nr:MAG: TRAP transporter large permease subunit [Alphaproteobacteria bacterium]
MSAAGLLLLLLAAFLVLGMPVGLALMLASLAAIAAGSEVDALALLGGDLWRSLTAPELVALPLFILMGELVSRGGLADEVFRALAKPLARLPGGLLQINIVAATLFAAITGSSAATTATVGRITVPALLKAGYERRAVVGSLAGAGTLGFLIPPSLVLILYGVVARQSIIDLFLAGILPGMLFAVLAMVWLGVTTRPPLARAQSQDGTSSPFTTAAFSPWPLAKLALVIGAVIGGMAAGIIGPSEAASLGAALVIGVQGRRFLSEPKLLWQAVLAAARSAAVLTLLLAGALFFAKAVALFGIAPKLTEMVSAARLGPFALFMLLVIAHAIAGMLLDGLSLVLLSVPLTLPLAVAAGFHPVWYGIVLVITVEMAQITPPVGFNLFIVRDIAGVSIAEAARAAWPFFSLLFALALLLYVVPELALWPL